MRVACTSSPSLVCAFLTVCVPHCVLPHCVRTHAQVGTLGASNKDVVQCVEVLEEEGHKWDWLQQRLAQFTANGSVLVFVSTR